MIFNSNRQSGMALLVCLAFLLVLSLIGLSSMQSATEQQKKAGGVWFVNQSFQAAETALRQGEAQVLKQWPALMTCVSAATCVPPLSAGTQTSSGVDPVSGVLWMQVSDGLYGLQSLGAGVTPAQLPNIASASFYRITGIGLHGPSRTVLESVFVRYQSVGLDVDTPGQPYFRRVMWRQLQ